MTKARVHPIGARRLIVLDGLLRPGELADLISLMDRAAFVRHERDSEATAHIRQWVRDFPVPDFEQQEITARLRAAVARHLGRQPRRLGRVYCNSIAFGDMLFPHRDCAPARDDVTALIYVTDRWERAWGGETIFYDDDGEVAAAVLPRPGRVAIFHGAIEHRASAPQRECYRPRLTFALKFVADQPRRSRVVSGARKRTPSRSRRSVSAGSSKRT